MPGLKIWRLGSFPHNSVGKESICNAGDPGLTPGSGRFPWRRERLPTPVFLVFSCGSAGKESGRNVGDLGSIPQLGRSLEKQKATYSSIPAWRISWTVQSMGLQRSDVDTTLELVTNVDVRPLLKPTEKNHQSNQMPGWFTCMLTFEKCYVEAPPFSEAANPGHSKERNPHGLGNLPIPGRLLPIRRKNGYPQTCLHRDIHWGLMKIFPTGYGLWCCYTSWLD